MISFNLYQKGFAQYLDQGCTKQISFSDYIKKYKDQFFKVDWYEDNIKTSTTYYFNTYFHNPNGPAIIIYKFRTTKRFLDVANECKWYYNGQKFGLKSEGYTQKQFEQHIKLLAFQ